MKNQDQQLDGVLNVVSNMKELASVMGNELDDQTRLLGDLEMQVDTTQSNLGHGIKKVNDFIKANASSKQQYVIACLIIGLVILIILIFTM